MKNEILMGCEEFMVGSAKYLSDLLGISGDIFHENTDLIEEGFLDSILLIAYLGFIERARGSELSEIPDLNGSLTFNSAYQLYLS